MYYVFTGLQGIGVIDSVERTLKEVIHDSKAFAQICVPKLGQGGNINAFVECVKNPPRDYTPSKYEKDTEAAAEIFKKNVVDHFVPTKNPYDSSADNYDEWEVLDDGETKK